MIGALGAVAAMLPLQVGAQTAFLSSTEWGTVSATLTTRHGRVIVILPEGLAAGDTVSGSVVLNPLGDSEAERLRNRSELGKLNVRIGASSTVAGGGTGRWTVPAQAERTVRVSLMDARGQAVGSGEVPIMEAASSPTVDFWLPQVGQAGYPIQVAGPFNGDVSDTSLSVGGRVVGTLAESPRRAVFLLPPDVSGATGLELKEGDILKAGTLHTIRVRLSSPLSVIGQGQTSTLTLEVSGLEGLDDEVPVFLRCATPDIVGLEGGTNQVVLVRPKPNAATGMAVVHRKLTGLRAGTYSVVAFVSPHIFFGLSWHTIKEGLNAAEFRDFMDGVIAGLEAKAADKKTGKTVREAIEGVVPKLRAAQGLASTTLPGLDVAKEVADNELAKIDAIDVGASLVDVAMGNPAGRLSVAYRALKTILYALIKQLKDKKKKEALERKVEELQNLEKKAEDEKDEAKRKDIDRQISEKLREIADIVKK